MITTLFYVLMGLFTLGLIFTISVWNRYIILQELLHDVYSAHRVKSKDDGETYSVCRIPWELIQKIRKTLFGYE